MLSGVTRAGVTLLVAALIGAALTVEVFASPTRPAAQFVSLRVAGALAVGPDGRVYVADVEGHRVLVRLPDGRFRVVAGDGRAGFAGDGGPAVRAELSNVTDLAFGSGGRLYIADGRRVRVVGRDGVVRTVAGPLALRDGALWIAFSPSGQLYISTGARILRARGAAGGGGLETVASGAPDGFGPIAVDSGGNVDVGGLARGWSIWRVAPGGAAREIGYARRTGGDDPVLQRAPGGAIYGDSGPFVVRVARQRLVKVFDFTARVNGEYFSPTYFAFGPGGTLYADGTPPGEGFQIHQQIVSVRDRHVGLLWEAR